MAWLAEQARKRGYTNEIEFWMWEPTDRFPRPKRWTPINPIQLEAAQ